MSRATYYFYVNKEDKDLKNQDIIDKIKEIFYANKKRYGYRRITLELKNQGININHKKVLRLMNKLNLHSITRKKRNILLIKELLEKLLIITLKEILRQINQMKSGLLM